MDKAQAAPCPDKKEEKWRKTGTYRCTAIGLHWVLLVFIISKSGRVEKTFKKKEKTTITRRILAPANIILSFPGLENNVISFLTSYAQHRQAVGCMWDKTRKKPTPTSAEIPRKYSEQEQREARIYIRPYSVLLKQALYSRALQLILYLPFLFLL